VQLEWKFAHLQEQFCSLSLHALKKHTLSNRITKGGYLFLFFMECDCLCEGFEVALGIKGVRGEVVVVGCILCKTFVVSNDSESFNSSVCKWSKLQSSCGVRAAARGGFFLCMLPRHDRS
jgi:hypothetical protein